MWPDASVDVSVVLCTWNRDALLTGALDALLGQRDAPPFELIVVDNASTDNTPAILQDYSSRHPAIRVIAEPRPGLSFARNTGAGGARGAVIAFTDDDVRVSAHWLRDLVRECEANPEAAYLGGPVVPQWSGAVPAWLTERHWAPLGIQHYGNRAIRIDRAQPLCLIGANLAVRREAIALVGGFSTDVQRVALGSGSTEDQEWQLRAWAEGCHGVYVPALAVTAIVTPDRIEKPHHRRWHFGHGRHVARMQIEEIERSRWHLAGVPGHLLRSAVAAAGQWLTSVLRHNDRTAFDAESRFWFAVGFARERWG